MRHATRHDAAEVLRVFLKLGLTSFGGPVAHLGYFRTEFVERRGWLDERSYADLVALCQFLPGPASSQVGMAIGLSRAGWMGALAAWCGFTLPSAVAMIVFALGLAQVGAMAAGGVVHGLKIAAVAVVAQAVWGMARSLCPDHTRRAIAVVAALLVALLPSAWSQVIAIGMAGLLGSRLLKRPPVAPSVHHRVGVSQTAGKVLLAVFVLLLLGLPLVAAATGSTAWQVVEGFYRAGALVFGGGHVVLPLLQATVVPGGLVSNEQFMAGYGAAQAVPGPLFTFAAFLGAAMQGPFSGWAGGLAMLLVIFLPAFLLVAGALPFWERLRENDAAQSALAGVNAAVVGLLLAALYDPVWTSAIHTVADVAVALVALVLLMRWRIAPPIVVLVCAAAGWALLR